MSTVRTHLTCYSGEFTDCVHNDPECPMKGYPLHSQKDPITSRRDMEFTDWIVATLFVVVGAFLVFSLGMILIVATKETGPAFPIFLAVTAFTTWALGPRIVSLLRRL